MDPEAALGKLIDIDLVLGMHLDGAAEAAVDFALKFDLSFAIIPCCTCSKDFPNRMMRCSKTGKLRLVKSYQDLTGYLLAKHPDIKMQRLDFEGKNVVLYRKVPRGSPRTTGE